MVNQLASTLIGLKTLMETWNGKPVDYLPYIHLFILCTTPKKEWSWIQNPINVYSQTMMIMWRGITCGIPLPKMLLLKRT